MNSAEDLERRAVSKKKGERQFHWQRFRLVEPEEPENQPSTKLLGPQSGDVDERDTPGCHRKLGRDCPQDALSIRLCIVILERAPGAYPEPRRSPSCQSIGVAENWVEATRALVSQRPAFIGEQLNMAYSHMTR